MRTIDTLIIGQGLAGTAAAWMLHRRGADFLIVDADRSNSSSRIAAGLVTPITGARHVGSWAWEKAFPIAESFYRECERLTGQHFWSVAPALRLFQSSDERAKYDLRYRSSESGSILPNHVGSEDTYRREMEAIGIQDPYGGFVMPQAARLITSSYLSASRDFFYSAGQLINAQVEATNGIVLQSHLYAIESLEVLARRILFCDGHQSKHNPWFQSMELVPAQGDILTVSIPGLNLKRVLHAGFWIAEKLDSTTLLQNQKDLYDVGSTYRWSPLDGIPSVESREILAEKLSKLLELPFTILDHRAAIRPAGFDHKPLLGNHPQQPNLWMLNGLGAKGVLLAPWCAEMVVDAINGRGTILPELTWDRRRKKAR